MEEFKTDIANKNLTDAEILNKHLLCGNPFVFGNDAGLYSSLKSKVAIHFKVDVTKVYMMGSAKLGFSIDPHQLWKLFDDESDIDMVIVSDEVFDSLWKEISDLKSDFYDRTELDERKYNSFLKYFFKGWIRPDFLPKSHPCFLSWDEHFLNISYKEFGKYKITGAVFKNEYFFRKYFEKNISQIR